MSVTAEIPRRLRAGDDSLVRPDGTPWCNAVLVYLDGAYVDGCLAYDLDAGRVECLPLTPDGVRARDADGQYALPVFRYGMVAVATAWYKMTGSAVAPERP